MLAAWERFWFTAVPRSRLGVLRVILHAYVWVDVLILTSFVREHGSVDRGLYAPLLLGRVLRLPAPTSATVTATMVVVLAASAVGVSGRLPRLAAWTVAVAYLQWMVFAFSYGKVDHDRFPLIVALFVVAAAGSTRTSDPRPSVAAGWAIRMVQVAVVSVYFLSVVAKVRYGGWLWANSATLTQALVRRGTSIGRSMLDDPGVLIAAQWGAVVFEATSVAMLSRRRVRWAWWWAAIIFHAVTFLVLSIAFFPQLVCLLAFLPLERITKGGRRESSVRGPAIETATS